MKSTFEADGNNYMVGIFSGTADFDPESGVFNLTSAGGQDVCVGKLDSDGAGVYTLQQLSLIVR